MASHCQAEWPKIESQLLGRHAPLAVHPDVPIGFGIGARRPRFHKPRVPVRGVVQNQVRNHFDVALARFGYQAFGTLCYRLDPARGGQESIVETYYVFSAGPEA